MKKIITRAVIFFMLFTSCSSKRQSPSSDISFQHDAYNFFIGNQLPPELGILVVVRNNAGEENYSKIIFIGYHDRMLIAFDPQQRIAAGYYTIIASQKDNFINQKILLTGHKKEGRKRQHFEQIKNS